MIRHQWADREECCGTPESWTDTSGHPSQPLFALAKQIQWKWPESYSEDQIVVIFGGLHIEMVALKTLGTGCKGVVGCKHLCKPRLRQQGQRTHSCEHPMSCAQEEHIK
ncbi:hypothetical protein AAFF_G00179440 [Aldrovandia affinis]|uniref:Uncharacterized protein n=1 Tax=Aldrovandia affinis TaxID=143900 RepID=A0AAD7RKL2_9TELE|nr:hypothetical protein AAFF_G00179440 [Aldrovandia affinis]